MDPTNAYEIHDAYWALNRAHKGLHDALTSISTAKWKDCQKAARAAEEKVEDAIEVAKTTTVQGIERLRHIHLPAKKAAAASNPEKMRIALIEALRITKEMEEEMLRVDRGHAAPRAQLEHLKTSMRKKGAYGVSRKQRRTHRKRNRKFI
jgi:hypothetical protein